MSDEQVIRHCAPTLARLKTANMFTCPFDSREEMLQNVRLLNKRLQRKGLCVLPLRYREGLGLIYVFRPAKLADDLNGQTARSLLSACGYRCQSTAQYLRCLMARLEADGEFPHEIGLFLGYPPEDVEGFMRCPNGCKCCGCWKVYGDAEKARRTFARYRKCADVYMRLWAQGRSIERLTVAG